MNPRWTHITFTVSDLDCSVEFYRKWCGLSVVRDRRAEGGSTVWLSPSDARPDELPTFIMVLMRGTVTDRLDHLGFQCAARAEVDNLAQAAQAQGILAEGPHDSGGVVGYWAIIRDPDGHLVEFTHGQPLRGLL